MCKMGSRAMQALALCAILSMCIDQSASISFNEKVVANQVKYDATWIDKDANDMVDIIFVMDRSGSVSSAQFGQAKSFVKNFLNYFSIAIQHTQVGVVLFGTEVQYPIALRSDNDKCQFMEDLDRLSLDTGGGTNAKDGLNRALMIIRMNSRRNHGAKSVVVFITDGDWNTGGDPQPIVKQLKDDPLNTLLIVITIGIVGRRNEMLAWASKDNKGQPMAFAVESFNAFEDIAYYIHKGTQASKFLPTTAEKCNSPICVAGASCVCDTLADLGIPACACQRGQYVKTVGGSQTCDDCPKGEYHDELYTISGKCKPCPDGQTTLAVASQAMSQCVCDRGFWNKYDQSNRPPCSSVECVAFSKSQLDSHHISLNGSCQYTYNQTCHYMCHVGYITSGVTELVCRDGGRMNLPLPMCTELLCPKLATIPNSEGWKCSNKEGTNFSFRTRCRTNCNPGYIPRNGTSSINCGLDESRDKAKWSGTELVCGPVTCQPLSEIKNAQYNLPACSSETADILFGQVCSLLCYQGYVISEDIKWTCMSNGQWNSTGTKPTCRDVTPPRFINCQQDIFLDNTESEGYALVQLRPQDAFDNDNGTIEQSMNLTLEGEKEGTEYPCENNVCGQEYFELPIGKTSVKFTASDRTGNTASCIFTVTVKDIENPEVVECEGPVTDDKGFIFSDQDEAFVNWTTPTFKDNSGKYEIYRDGDPGMYMVGKTWTVTYTAEDTEGNKAVCRFTFKLSAMRCPELHRPANGALVCDKLAFGVYCAPHCKRGLKRLLPENIRRVTEYGCSKKGTWAPHDTIGDCAVNTPVNDETLDTYMFTWYEGDCNEEQTQQKIIQNTIDAMNSMTHIKGYGFAESAGVNLTTDHFEVFCGAKNESIVQIELPERQRRDMDTLSQDIIKTYGTDLDQN